MAIETAKEQICINQIIGKNKEIMPVEGDVIVNDVKPDVLNIINTNGTVCIHKKEIIDGTVRIEGTINTYIIYLADDENGSIRSLNTNLDFMQSLEINNCKDGMTVDEDVRIKNFDCKILNGRKINVKAFIETNVKVYSNENFEMINNIENIEDIQVLKTDENVISLIGEGENKMYAKDTISIDEIDDLAEIMKVDFKIINEETKVSYNKILSKSDADINIMYLTEDNRINIVNTRIPIMGFVDMPNVSENCICDTRNKLKNLVVKPNKTEEHSIYIEAEINLSCYTYEVKQLNIVKDLYSTSCNVQFNQNEIETMVKKDKIKDNCNIKEKIHIQELLNEKVYNVSVNPSITKTTIRNNKALYEGEIELEVLFKQNNGINAQLVSLPFNFEVNSDSIKENGNVDTQIQVKQENFVVLSDGNIQVDVELEFNLCIEDNRTLKIINEILEEECINPNLYSMVIYFVKPDDTIWKIAKNFKSRVEDIMRINNIESEKNIYNGQQLYIPRFARTSVAV